MNGKRFFQMMEIENSFLMNFYYPPTYLTSPSYPMFQWRNIPTFSCVWNPTQKKLRVDRGLKVKFDEISRKFTDLSRSKIWRPTQDQRSEPNTLYILNTPIEKDITLHQSLIHTAGFDNKSATLNILYAWYSHRNLWLLLLIAGFQIVAQPWMPCNRCVK